MSLNAIFTFHEYSAIINKNTVFVTASMSYCPGQSQIICREKFSETASPSSVPTLQHKSKELYTSNMSRKS